MPKIRHPLPDATSQVMARLHDPDQHMLPVKIIGLLRLNGNPGIQSVKDILAHKLVQLPLFRCRLVKDNTDYVAEEVDNVDLDQHCQLISRPMNANDVDRLCKDIHTEQVDLDVPQWKILLIENYLETKSLLVFVVDHWMADGVYLSALLSNVIVDQPQQQLESTSRGVTKDNSWFRWIASFFKTTYRDMTTATVQEEYRTPFMATDPSTIGCGMNVACTSESCSLDKFKAIKNMYPGATVATVVIAAIAATVRAYLEETHHEALETNQPFPFVMAVNMRAPSKNILTDSKGNNFGIVKILLPVSYTSYDDLIQRSQHELELVKTSIFPSIALFFTQIIKRVSSDTLRNLTQSATHSSCGTIAAVRGPDNKVQVLGCDVEDINFCAFPLASTYIGVVTYNNQVNVSLTMCLDQCDPHDITKHWGPAVESMYQGLIGQQPETTTD